MNKNQSLVLFAFAAAIIAVVALGASVYILADGNPENDGSIAQIFTFAGGIIVAIFALRSMLDSIHSTMNSRLDELVETTREAALSEGRAMGRKIEEDRDKTTPIVPQGSVTINKVEVDHVDVKSSDLPEPKSKSKP